MFGRITEVKEGTGVVAEYRYKGLFQQTVTTTDRDGDSSLSGEHAHFHVYDDWWRVIKVWREDATSGLLDDFPKQMTL